MEKYEISCDIELPPDIINQISSKYSFDPNGFSENNCVSFETFVTPTRRYGSFNEAYDVYYDDNFVVISVTMRTIYDKGENDE